MDQGQFTTTFIPKKPLADVAPTGAQPVSRPAGLLSSISVILFFVTILIAGGVYFWKGYETTNVAALADSIKKIEKTFEPELVTKLQSLDRQLKNGSILVKGHTVTSPIFDLLENTTLKSVKFTKFDIAFDSVKGTQVKMSGEADGYRSIAQQSDVFAASNYLKDAIFSNFFLTPKGRISFDLSFGVKPDFVDFEKAPLSGVTTQ